MSTSSRAVDAPVFRTTKRECQSPKAKHIAGEVAVEPAGIESERVPFTSR